MNKFKLSICDDRIAEAKERISKWYRGEKVDRTPFCFSVSADFGEGWLPANPYNFQELIESTDKVVEANILSINRQSSLFPDTDYLPMFSTFYLGEGIVPSMFGAKQLVVSDNPPFTEGRLLKSIYDVEKLPERIDPENSEWGKKLKDAAVKFLHATDCKVPIAVNDHQSPYGVATKLIGNEDLIFAMYDEPELVHKLLRICSQAIIDSAEAMISYCGKENVSLNPSLGIGGYDSFILWDDYISVLTPELHIEFCRPYNKKLYDHFGPGHLHTCGPYFPGFIDSVLACDPVSVDISAMRSLTKTRKDMLELRRITKEHGILLVGGLSTSENSQFENNGHSAPDRELFEQMSDGGLFWKESGSVELGMEYRSWLNG